MKAKAYKAYHTVKGKRQAEEPPLGRVSASIKSAFNYTNFPNQL